MVRTRYSKGRDGKTAYERMKGTKCDIPVVAFGELVWYKELKDGGTKENKLESPLQEGIWLGHVSRTTETLIGTIADVVKVWSTRRSP